LTTAIRKHDPHSLITVGIIPWALVFKGAKPVFYAPGAARHLDFVSIHVYPKSAKIKEEIDELSAYEIGKPLVVEEFFPLACNMDELKAFMDLADDKIDGWISHYFGHTIEEHQAGADPGGPKTASFLNFRNSGPLASDTLNPHSIPHSNFNRTQPSTVAMASARSTRSSLVVSLRCW